jgi:predicted Zn finger-like uncharacterized protein
MQINCPKCQTSYDVRDSSVGSDGRKVRCIRCETVWFVAPPTPEPFVTRHAAAEESAAGSPPGTRGPSSEPTGADERGEEIAPQPETARETAQETAETGAEPHPDEPDAETALPVPRDLDAGRGPVEISDAPSIIPPQEQSPPLADPGLQEPMSRQARLILDRKPAPRAFPTQAVLVAALAAAVAALVILRQDVVRYAPQTASLYDFIGLPVNLRGLAFADVKTLHEMQDKTPVLVVQGRIVSVSSQTADVPRLRFSVRDAKGGEIQSWTALADRKILAPGESLDFTSRLAAPPDGATDVLVRFFNRRDLAASNR